MHSQHHRFGLSTFILLNSCIEILEPISSAFDIEVPAIVNCFSGTFRYWSSNNVCSRNSNAKLLRAAFEGSDARRATRDVAETSPRYCATHHTATRYTRPEPFTQTFTWKHNSDCERIDLPNRMDLIGCQAVGCYKNIVIYMSRRSRCYMCQSYRLHLRSISLVIFDRFLPKHGAWKYFEIVIFMWYVCLPCLTRLSRTWFSIFIIFSKRSSGMV